MKEFIITYTPRREQVAQPLTKTDLVSGKMTLETQFDQVQKLQRRWDSAIGQTTSEETKLASNYNPVLARWNFERMEDDVQKKSFRDAEMKNIETALRERNQTSESRLTFTFDTNGKVRNEMFPDEPYENMLERGRVYREKHGSKEAVREQAEIDGFAKIQTAFADKGTPVGTKYMMISPPSKQKDSIYSHNFVDMYELAKDEKTGEKVIQYTRFASNLDYDQYADIAEKTDPTFFISKALKEEDKKEPIPDDAWYLANPLKVTSTESFTTDIKAMEEKEWQKLWKLYVPFAMHLLDTLTKDHFDPKAIAKAYNTLLHSGENEELMEQMEKREKVIFNKDHTNEPDATQQVVLDMVGKYGQAKVAEKSVGCGSSGGITISKGAGVLMNSVAQFGMIGGRGGGQEQEAFSCPECPYKARSGERVGDSCPGCGLTKEAYAEKSGISCD